MKTKIEVQIGVKRSVLDGAIRAAVCFGVACLGEVMLALGSVVICGWGATIPTSAIAVVGIGSLVSAWIVTR
jgi:hypothetical protein